MMTVKKHSASFLACLHNSCCFCKKNVCSSCVMTLRSYGALISTIHPDNSLKDTDWFGHLVVSKNTLVGVCPESFASPIKVIPQNQRAV